MFGSLQLQAKALGGHHHEQGIRYGGERYLDFGKKDAQRRGCAECCAVGFVRINGDRISGGDFARIYPYKQLIITNPLILLCMLMNEFTKSLEAMYFCIVL